MADMIRALAADKPGGSFQPFEYDPGPLGEEAVEIKVEHCGICHSDLSMLDNEWRRTTYPFVPGPEVVGIVAAVGPRARGVKVGQRVGLGWLSASCMHCAPCIGGDQHLCVNSESTIVGRYGGFADRVRCHWSWAIPLPDGVDIDSAGPLFCGGITVFSPIVINGVVPTDRVGVVGIGGLGHMAIKFLRHWGCEVTAFTSSESKRTEAMAMGAHHVVSSTDKASLKAIAGSLDFILVTVNVALEWNAYIAALRPKGRLHVVGAIMEPMAINARALLGQKWVGGSPIGNPTVMRAMLEFCARHRIAPQVETFPMAQANEAMEHLRAGKARYRVVLKA